MISLFRRFQWWLQRNRKEDELREELEFHLAEEASERQAGGLPASESTWAARRELGNATLLRENVRAMWSWALLEQVAQDVRYAFRTLRKTPAFTAIAVLTLALGIGANTAIYSLVDAVLFKTLPLENGRELYFLAQNFGPNRSLSTASNYPLFERYRALPVFSGVTAYQLRTLRIRTPESIERVSGQYVSGNYHALLGVPMSLGRGFSTEPDRQPGASLIAVISHDYWVRRFRSDPDVLGQPLTVGGRTLSIVGITAPRFGGLDPGVRVDVTLPISVLAMDAPRFLDNKDGFISLVMVGRLAPGINEKAALPAVDSRLQQFLTEPEIGWTTRDGPRPAMLVPATRGTWGIREQYRRPLWVSLSMVAIVLLIACANVANLLLERAEGRTREIAVRLSLGAGRIRLTQQLVTEGLVLAACGGAAGLVLSRWLTDAILTLVAVGPAPPIIAVDVNGRVLAFTTAVALLAGVGFGLAPAIRSTALDLASSLKSGPRSMGRRHGLSMGQLLIVVQVALSVVLVAAAGLLARSLVTIQSFDAGFDRENVLLADVDVAAAGASGQRSLLYGQLLGRVASMPGVRSASLSTRSPIDMSWQVRRIDVPGVPARPDDGVSSNIVTPEYFDTLGIALTRGRTFTNSDRAESPRVAVVSESMAQAYFGDAEALGRTFQLGGDKEVTEIVGIVQDARHERLRAETMPWMVYLPLAQMGVPTQLTIVARVDREARSVAGLLTNELRSVNPDVLVPYLRTMQQQVGATLVPERLLTMLSSALAGLAMLLACVGLYGLMVYRVTGRTREIGIRMALGAGPGTVVGRVLHETLSVTVIGVVMGVLLALATTRTVAAFLFRMSPHDPLTFVTAAGMLLVVALVAAFVPARRAARVDPMVALRCE
jgi:predicted permease